MSEIDRTGERAARPVSRRQFLSRVISVAVAAPAAMALLQACSSAPAAPAAGATSAAPVAATSAPVAPPTSAPAAQPTAAVAATASGGAAATAGPAVVDGSKSARDIGDKPPIKFEFSPESDLRDQDKALAKQTVDASKFKKTPPFTIGYSDASVSN